MFMGFSSVKMLLSGLHHERPLSETVVINIRLHHFSSQIDYWSAIGLDNLQVCITKQNLPVPP